MQANYVQRLRFRFRKFGPTRYIGHLDLARTMERALNRARLPVAYTQGFNQRPRMQFATALPLGYSSEMEIMDVLMQETIEPEQALSQLASRMAPGIEVYQTEEVDISEPSLQAQTVDSRYLITFSDDIDAGQLRERLEALLAAKSLLRHKRSRSGKKGKEYDLRPLLLDAKLLEEEGEPVQLLADLRLEPSRTGRPDELIDELGIDPLEVRVCRLRLRLQADLAPARS